jgi:hypothetical protein
MPLYPALVAFRLDHIGLNRICLNAHILNGSLGRARGVFFVTDSSRAYATMHKVPSRNRQMIITPP